MTLCIFYWSLAAEEDGQQTELDILSDSNALEYFFRTILSLCAAKTNMHDVL